MSRPSLLPAAPLTRSVDALGAAVQRLHEVLPQREDTQVLVDFVEDELREGMDAVAEVEGHFRDILEVLHSERLSPIRLLDVADDTRVLERLAYLEDLVGQIRRRLSRAAARWVDNTTESGAAEVPSVSTEAQRID